MSVRRGSSPIVLERTKRRAPVWRKNFDKLDTPRRAPSLVVGVVGSKPDCRWSRNQVVLAIEFKTMIDPRSHTKQCQERTMAASSFVSLRITS